MLHPDSHPSSQGFTLIELITALTLSGIACTLAMGLWFGMVQNVRIREQRGLGVLGAQTSIFMLEGILEQARTFRFQDESHLLWTRWNGSCDTLWWDEDSLRLNGRSLFQDPPLAVQFVVSSAADSLGHVLSTEDLDRDYSRSLDSLELVHAALIEIHLTFSQGAPVRIVQAIRAQNP